MARPVTSEEPLAAIGAARVVPVITVREERELDALPRLVAGSAVVEVTLRTGFGFEAIRRVASLPGLVVGAGTVLDAPAAARAIAAGGRFIVSPGLDASLVTVLRDAGLTVIPGVCTPTEVQAAVQLGLTRLKFFPAEAAGGIPMLRALAGPFPEVRFMPSGGIDAATAPAYLAEPNVFAVGGSWMLP